MKKKARPPPHHFNRTAPTTTEPEKEKPVQSHHPPQESTQINCTGPALHAAEPHTKNLYDPARQRNSHGPSTPKVNKARTSIIDG